MSEVTQADFDRFKADIVAELKAKLAEFRDTLHFLAERADFILEFERAEAERREERLSQEMARHDGLRSEYGL